MSDFMFMLESHLSPEQNQVVAVLESAAEASGAHVFLTGGAMRDMLGGFPIRDLDFTVEGNPAKVVKQITQKGGAKVTASDDSRKSFQMLFPNGVSSELAMAIESRYPKAASKPVVKPATIHEDLKGRDFTINSIAISLNKGSRGLLLDPMNGRADLESRELRANNLYTLYDDPGRILRMFRMRARLGFELDPRTQSQYENVREAKLEEKISRACLLEELHHMSGEPNLEFLMEIFDHERLWPLFSPALAGSKLNASGISKLEKARQMVPFGAEFHAEYFGLFVFLLAEKLSAKEKSELIKHLGMPKSDVEAWQKIEQKSKPLEKTLKSARLNKASAVYQTLRQAQGELVLFLFLRTGQRLVHDRIKNHLTKYLAGVQEVTDKDVATHFNADPADGKFKKLKEDYTLALLDGRIRKPVPPPEPMPISHGPGRPPGGPGRPPGGPGRPPIRRAV